jgi:hypothetical protein
VSATGAKSALSAIPLAKGCFSGKLPILQFATRGAVRVEKSLRFSAMGVSKRLAD